MKKVLAGILCLYICIQRAFAAEQMNETLSAGHASGFLNTDRPISITGSKTITFLNRTIEGSREGYIPGYERQESLQVDISATNEGDAEVHIKVSSGDPPELATSYLRRDRVEISASYSSNEVFFGDFNAGLNETEFTQLSSMLSGIRIRNVCGNIRSQFFLSSPQGRTKYFKSYGNFSQGPFVLTGYPVIVESEKVYLNSIIQVKGMDYIINYATGELVFLSRALNDRDIIEAYYDSSGTLYEHSTLGFRSVLSQDEHLQTGVTYINDHDKAASGYPEDPPLSHYVIGFDSIYRDGGTAANMELAYSWLDEDLLSGSNEATVGKAFKFGIEKKDDRYDASIMMKRIDEGYYYISSQNNKRDSREYAVKLGYKLTDDLEIRGASQYAKYRVGDLDQLNESNNIDMAYSLNGYMLTYGHSVQGDLRDPVYDTEISRISENNKAGVSSRYGFIEASLDIQLENEKRSEPSFEASDNQTYDLAISTYGLDKVSVSGNVNLVNRISDAGTVRIKTCEINATSSPFDGYYLAANFHRTDDGEAKDTAGLSYQATPIKWASTRGRYTVSTINEYIASSQEIVSKQSGMFDLCIFPSECLRIGFAVTPNITKALKGGRDIHIEMTDQYDIEYAPSGHVKSTATYRKSNRRELDRTDPLLLRLQDISSDSLFNMNIKLIISDRLSFNINYSDELIKGEQLSPESSSYIKSSENSDIFEATVNYLIMDGLDLISNYSRDIRGRISDALSSSMYQKISAGLDWSINGNWTLSVKAGQILRSDTVTGDDPCAATTGVGASFRSGQFRADMNIEQNSTYWGEKSDNTTANASLSYDVTERLHSSLKLSRETSNMPMFIATEVMGSLELVF